VKLGHAWAQFGVSVEHGQHRLSHISEFLDNIVFAGILFPRGTLDSCDHLCCLQTRILVKLRA
jgi:hypothetical protein